MGPGGGHPHGIVGRGTVKMRAPEPACAGRPPILPRGAASRDPTGRVRSGTTPHSPIRSSCTGWRRRGCRVAPGRRASSPREDQAGGSASQGLTAGAPPACPLPAGQPRGSHSYRVLEAGEALHRPCWVGSMPAPGLQPPRLPGSSPLVCQAGGAHVVPGAPSAILPAGDPWAWLPSSSQVQPPCSSGPPPAPPRRQDTSKDRRGSVLASGPLSWCPSPTARGPPHPQSPLPKDSGGELSPRLPPARARCCRARHAPAGAE